MILNRQNKVILSMLIFLVVGTIVVVATHRPIERVSVSSVEVTEVTDYGTYIDNIRPWLQQVAIDQSRDSVIQIKYNLLNVRSSDKDLGDIHMNLFLAFESWEKFLSTQQESYRLQASQRLETAAQLMPELAGDIQQLNQTLN